MLLLGAASGLVFGAIEAVDYVVTAADERARRGRPWSSVWRFAIDPIIHALWAGVAGYFVGTRDALPHTRPLAGPRRGRARRVAALLHGV